MEKLQTYFFATLSLSILLLAFFIFLPFLAPLSIAATLAVVFYPFYERLARFCGERRGLAAFITVVAAIIIIFLPLALIGTIVFQEAREFVERFGEGGTGDIARAPAFIEDQIARFLPGFSLNVNEYARHAASWLIQNLGTIFSGFAQASLTFFLGLLAFYYFLRDGKKLLQNLIALSPLPDAHDHEILATLERAVNSIVRGSLGIALIQGILTGIGLAISGVPSPALFGSIATVAALIPGVGTALVLAPAIIFLFVTGSTGAGVGLLIWGVIAVGLIDNILRPVLLKRGIRVHVFLVLLSVIGGLKFFGPIGFLLGPIVLSLLFAMIEIYRHLMGSAHKGLSS
ncbi:MAG: AI-2E family transporter [Patescibacteria group bacterium]